MLIALDRKAFEHALTGWAEALLRRLIAAAASLPEDYALDGKSARGSFDGLQKAVHLLSLLAHESGLTLAQGRPGGRTRPTSTKPPFDCSRAGPPRASGHRRCHLLPARFLPAGDRCGGRYLVFDKDNQPTLLNDIRMARVPGRGFPLGSNESGSRHGHGDDPRQGTRSNRASHVEGDDGVERLSGLAGCWPSRTGRERGGQGRQDLARDRYFITSVSRPVAGGTVLKWAGGIGRSRIVLTRT